MDDSTTLERLELTPAIANDLLSKPHPKQRRPARQTVTTYANEIRRGRWRPYAPDPILVDRLGRMFNGAHRCAAVVVADMSIGVLIQRDADPDMFDIIDVGRKRSAYQFVAEAEATTRAGAARVILWYRHRVDHELSARTLTFFDMSEILETVDAEAERMTAALPHARAIYEWTGIGQAVALAVLVLAAERFEWDVVVAFREGIVDTAGLDATDPRKVLADKTRQNRWRERRRQQIDDWTVLVRALNAYVHDEPLTSIPMSVYWPLIGENGAAYDKRRRALSEKHRRGSIAAGSADTTTRVRRRRRA